MTEGSALTRLASGDCVPAGGHYQLLEQCQQTEFGQVLPASWQISDGRLWSTFRFDDYAAAIEFTNQIAALAEQQNHHPRLVLEWGSVTVVIWTHSVGGLAEGDFVFAAKVALLKMAQDEAESRP